MEKREFLRLGLVGLGGILASPAIANSVLKNRLIAGTDKSFKLPELRYGRDALYPFMDEDTVSFLHDNFHANLTRNLNLALKRAGTEGKTLREIQTNISQYPEAIRVNGGGFFNFRLFWKVISPIGKREPDGILRAALTRDFGSVENFKSEFTTAATSAMGSGWSWLIVRNGKLKITTTTGQDNPVMGDIQEQGRPVLCLNLHESAYSPLHHGNSSSYIESFWDFVDWDFVAKKYSKFRNLG